MRRDHNDELATWRRDFAPEIAGSSPEMLEALETLRRVAPAECNILILGSTGTGKELFARSVHRASTRGNRPLVSINCAAIPETLLETELFGHVKGAFTGATNARPGRFASADRGTIFLDEIGDLPLAAQAKLLRVLEERVVSPVGSDVDVPVDVRVIAATHRNLEDMVAQGKFRADLYFRLAVIPIVLPDLHDRGDDIIEIATSYLASACGRLGRPLHELDASARDALREYPWPGNVRELAHTLERSLLLTRKPTLSASDILLPPGKLRAPARHPDASGPIQLQPRDLGEETSLDLRRALEALERRMIDSALARAGGNRTEAAALLGLNRTTLVEKLRKHAA
ncbi:MAG TPA: sigma-54 dependent transcriptional regulator [Kofleriaceae bacterium]|jgi:transcriptional regulator with GAF, ATPase, and Fis domain